eukprot:6184800-Pleurochrysis_carterae.AAC.2
MALVPCKVIWHSQRSVELPVTARDSGQEILKCPKSYPARTANSPFLQASYADWVFANVRTTTHQRDYTKT